MTKKELLLAAALQSRAAAAEQAKLHRAVKYGGFRDYIAGQAKRARDAVADYERRAESADSGAGDAQEGGGSTNGT